MFDDVRWRPGKYKKMPGKHNKMLGKVCFFAEVFSHQGLQNPGQRGFVFFCLAFSWQISSQIA